MLDVIISSLRLNLSVALTHRSRYSVNLLMSNHVLYSPLNFPPQDPLFQILIKSIAGEQFYYCSVWKTRRGCIIVPCPQDNNGRINNEVNRIVDLFIALPMFNPVIVLKNEIHITSIRSYQLLKIGLKLGLQIRENNVLILLISDSFSCLPFVNQLQVPSAFS